MASNSLTTPYLVVSGVIILALASVVAFIQPQVAQIGRLREDIAATRAQLTTRQEFLRTLDTKVAALARESQHEKQLNVVLPQAEEHADVVRLIHQAAVASDGAIQRLSNISANVQSVLNARRSRREAVALPQNVTPLGFEIEFAGSYQQLRVFLSQLSLAPRLLDITNLEVRRSAQAIDTIGATLIVHFYHYQAQE